MTATKAAELIASDEDHEGYLEQFLILERMKTDLKFKDDVITIFNSIRVV